jgi:hypothetical protein
VRGVLADALGLVGAAIKLVLNALSAAVSAAWPPSTLPSNEEIGQWVLVILVGGGWTALILHGMYDLSRFFW